MIISSETTDFEIVKDVMKKTPLISLKLRWSWQEWDWLYVFEFSGAWMYGSKANPYLEDEIGLVPYL